MSTTIHIDPKPWDLAAIKEMAEGDGVLALSEESSRKIKHCRASLERRLGQGGELFYGINTGFGALYNVRISPEETEQLQHNLLQSHACGTGEEMPRTLVRIMALLKIKALAQGYSGVRPELVEQLIAFYNRQIFGVVYQLGSLGASGDLAPLAHFSLPLIGMGEVFHRGIRRSAHEALQEEGLMPLRLKSKEGIGLLNGTQFSTAYAVWCLIRAEYLFQVSNLCAAVALDAFDCSLAPFDDRIHQIRPHAGQILMARRIREWLEGSAIARQPKKHVQDPYAFRCVPQVHGASWDAVQHIRSVVLTEVNGVTDNPNVFPEEDEILSGGNFHGQPIALAMDYLAIALAELGSISERRIYQLISGARGLPDFLTEKPGLHSGLMMPQYTAASIVSQNKQWCTPASVDSIVSSKGQEDHVSMSANAATKACRVVLNVETVLAIEFMTAVQALEFRRPARSSPAIEAIVVTYRERVPRLGADRILYRDIAETDAFLKQWFNLKLGID